MTIAKKEKLGRAIGKAKVGMEFNLNVKIIESFLHYQQRSFLKWS